jgi:hypothetical protein
MVGDVDQATLYHARDRPNASCPWYTLLAVEVRATVALMASRVCRQGSSGNDNSRRIY